MRQRLLFLVKRFLKLNPQPNKPLCLACSRTVYGDSPTGGILGYTAQHASDLEHGGKFKLDLRCREALGEDTFNMPMGSTDLRIRTYEAS